MVQQQESVGDEAISISEDFPGYPERGFSILQVTTIQSGRSLLTWELIEKDFQQIIQKLGKHVKLMQQCDIAVMSSMQSFFLLIIVYILQMFQYTMKRIFFFQIPLWDSLRNTF
jgi:hypothetical protein